LFYNFIFLNGPIQDLFETGIYTGKLLDFFISFLIFPSICFDFLTTAALVPDFLYYKVSPLRQQPLPTAYVIHLLFSKPLYSCLHWDSFSTLVHSLFMS